MNRPRRNLSSAETKVEAEVDREDSPVAETDAATPGAEAMSQSRFKRALMRVLAAQRARQPRVTVADLRPPPTPELEDATGSGDSGDEHEREAEWARHVEWTLRMMS